MKKAIFVIVVAAAGGVASLLYLLKIRGDMSSDRDAQQPLAGINKPASPALQDGHSPNLPGHDRELATKEESARRLQQYIEKEMPEEDKRAMPKDGSIEWWALLSAHQKHEARQNGEVEFYGKLVDENRQPLQGVQIHVSVSSVQPTLAAVAASKDKTSGTSVEMKLTTDESGRFEVKNLRGRGLVLDYVALEGYEFAPGTENGFTFVPDGVSSTWEGPRHKADPNSPVVLVMRKTSRD